jgi:antitoxin (DNA-binding transcriptional repressor) of toxin-antitoxin stability system
MQAVTIREAKARLNALVEAAERGEQVVLMRGAQHVALIVPLSAEDLEVAPRLSDGQAERLWREIGAESRPGAGVVKDSPDAAVAYLAGAAPKRRRQAQGEERRRGRRRR